MDDYVCVWVCVMVLQKDDAAEADMDEEVAIPFPNLMEIAHFFEQGGVGVGREEFYRILLALKALLRENPTLQSVRFWGQSALHTCCSRDLHVHVPTSTGKIFGTKRDYIIAEAEYQEGEGEEEEEEENEGTCTWNHADQGVGYCLLPNQCSNTTCILPCVYYRGTR